MTPNPLQPAAPKSNDNEMLELLKWCFWGYAILTVLGALFVGVIFAFMGLGFAAAAKNQPHGQDLAMAGGVMGFVFLIVLVVVVGLAALWFFAGRFVSERRNYMFPFIAACLALPNMPLGTAMGIFALVILSRESVKQQFGR